jgi:TonB-dependent SusC/RagA subfamily outer membrane receptor
MAIRIVLFVLPSSFVLAQQIPRDTTSVTVSGRVFLAPDSLLGIPNAEIIFKGKSKGSNSKADGSFTIKGYLQTDTSILVAYPGYIAQEIRLGDIVEGLKIQLEVEPEIENLGIGKIKKSLSPFSVGTEKQQNLKLHPSNSVEGALQGRIAGLNVTQSTGLTSAAVSLRLRGNVNIMGDGNPLIVLDGVPLITGTNGDGSGSVGNTYGYQNSPLSEINPNDIDKVEVLKDGASQAMYGARGANGVILLTSKKGSPGKTKFNFNYNFGEAFLK